MTLEVRKDTCYHSENCACLSDKIASEIINRTMDCDNRLIHDYLCDILRESCVTSFTVSYKDGTKEKIRIAEE
jgi:hypothetical protein